MAVRDLRRIATRISGAQSTGFLSLSTLYIPPLLVRLSRTLCFSHLAIASILVASLNPSFSFFFFFTSIVSLVSTTSLLQELQPVEIEINATVARRTYAYYSRNGHINLPCRSIIRKILFNRLILIDSANYDCTTFVLLPDDKSAHLTSLFYDSNDRCFMKARKRAFFISHSIDRNN